MKLSWKYIFILFKYYYYIHIYLYHHSYLPLLLTNIYFIHWDRITVHTMFRVLCHLIPSHNLLPRVCIYLPQSIVIFELEKVVCWPFTHWSSGKLEITWRTRTLSSRKYQGHFSNSPISFISNFGCVMKSYIFLKFFFFID